MKIDIHGSFRARSRPMTRGTPGRYGAKPYDKRETWSAFAFLIALGLPFACAGLWGLLVQAPAKWAAHDTTGALFHAVAGFSFATIGCGLIAGSLWARGKAAKDAALAFAHPDEPWKWREDWAAGCALDRSANAAWAVAGFAVLWNAIAFPCGLLAFEAATAKHQPYAAIALVFPAAGIALLAWAWQIWSRARRQGASRFVLDAVPVPLGRTLSGTVHTRLTQVPPDGFEIVLSALRTISTAADDDSSTSIVWQEEARAPGQLAGDVDGVHAAVPIAIRLPAEAPSTDHSDGGDELEWKLVLRAKDYEATFDVPVYRTDETGMPETARDASHLRVVPAHGDPIPTSFAVPARAADLPRPEPHSPIEVSRDGAGLVVEFPPGRNPGPARFVTFFALFWTASIVFMTRVHVPVFLPLVFALVDCAFVWLAFRMWFESVRVRANGAGVKIARGLAQPGAERLYPAGEIADVRLSIGMSSGTNAWYDLGLFLKDGRKVGLGEGIRDKHEAEWLAAQILKTLGR